MSNQAISEDGETWAMVLVAILIILFFIVSNMSYSDEVAQQKNRCQQAATLEIDLEYCKRMEPNNE